MLPVVSTVASTVPRGVPIVCSSWNLIESGEIACDLTMTTSLARVTQGAQSCAWATARRQRSEPDHGPLGENDIGIFFLQVVGELGPNLFRLSKNSFSLEA